MQVKSNRHNRDALVAITAQFEGCAMLTEDVPLGRRARGQGIEVLYCAELLTASVKPTRINIRTGIRTVIKEYINHIRWTSTKPYSITGRGTVHYQNGSHHNADIRVYNPDIGLGKHKYFGNMKVGGTKYAWDNVSGWHRV